MSSSALNWIPEPQLLKQMIDLAQERGQSLDALLTEAIVVYLNMQRLQDSEPSIPKVDPLVGLFSGSPDLATQSEVLLEQETTQSGWTWK
jgi:hypothetical protein